MKLIYLANIGLPSQWAHEIQIMKMCEAFAANGAKVELVVPRRVQNIEQNLHAFYGVKNNFKITQLACWDLAPGSIGRLYFWLRSFSFLISAKRYLTNKQYDILYTRDQLGGKFFKDYILEIHSLPEKIKPFHKKIWQRAKSLVVLTSFIKAGLIESGVSENKIIVAPDGVDIAEFDLFISQEAARQKTNLPLNKKIILYTGSFYLRDWKGVDILLEAAKYFDENYCFVLVGGEEGEIEKIQEQYQLKNLILVPRQPHQQIPYYLKAADVLVLPNKKGDAMSERYTSPLKLFEYMAAQRPIVASDLPSIREVLNGQNSILVAPNDPFSLAEGIRKVLINKELAQRLAQKAFKNVQNYSWQNRAQKILNFIRPYYGS